MTYDMHGAFEPNQTNNQSPIFQSPSDPSANVPPGDKKYSIDTAITAWTAGLPAYGIPGGFPANKLTMASRSITADGRACQRAPTTVCTSPRPARPGPAASARCPASPTTRSSPGIVDNPSTTYWDAASQSAYFYNGSEYWTGENTQSIKAKIDYLHCKGMGGAMMFSLLDLDPAATLFNATVNASTALHRPRAAAAPHRPRRRRPTPPTTPPTTPTHHAAGGSCTAPAWSATTVYVGGNQVSYDGHTWQAKWWTAGRDAR
jgi:chitinase